MLQSTIFKFLKELKINNNKAWFDANRKTYEIIKTDFSGFVQQLIIAISKFDEPIGKLSPKDCLFRINRDIRFSKDKTPYKSNMGASISKAGKKINVAGYYIHCEPGKSMAAGGFYMPSGSDLLKIRQEIDYNFEEWKKIIHHKNFKKYFPKGVDGIEYLVRPPKGYDHENAAIEFLKMKSFIVTCPLSNSDLTDKTAIKKVAAIFNEMKPMIDFLNRSIE